jgi:hypothetical protein
VHGNWTVAIKYSRGTGEQHFKLEQIGNDLTGAQQGELYKTAIQGSVHVNQIELRSAMSVSGNAIPWTFKGEVQGNEMAGTVNLGEYGEAAWHANRVEG